jgi:hypothetical protein
MKLSFLVAGAFLAGPCSSVLGDAPETGGPASAAAMTSAAPAATAAATPAAATTVAPVATPPPHASGPCAVLAQKCKKCPPGVVQVACNGALTAGALDPEACTNALNDKDIKAECGGGGGPAPAPTTTTSTQPAPSPAPAGGGPCAELAKKCAKCPAGVVKMACSGALTAGSLDPTACTNALNDKDIKGQCN